MRYKRLARGVASGFRQFGWLDGSLRLLNRLLVRASRGRVRVHKYVFVAQPVSTKRWLSGRRGAAIEVRQVGASDPLVKVLPRPAWAIPYRFEQGAICFAALKDGDCVGFLWLLLGPYQEDEVRCRYIPLPQGKASWDFDVYVYPEHRNSLVFLRLWDEANRFLAARGVRWSLSRISAFNAGSMSSHTRMGAKRIGTAVFLSIGSWQISGATVRPHFSVSVRRDSFPAFALNAELQ
jgi:hypothetical protein